jgi:hypothetical protein
LVFPWLASNRLPCCAGRLVANGRQVGFQREAGWLPIASRLTSCGVPCWVPVASWLTSRLASSSSQRPAFSWPGPGWLPMCNHVASRMASNDLRMVCMLVLDIGLPRIASSGLPCRARLNESQIIPAWYPSLRRTHAAPTSIDRETTIAVLCHAHARLTESLPDSLPALSARARAGIR